MATDDMIRFSDGPFAGKIAGTRVWPPPEIIPPEECDIMSGGLSFDTGPLPEGFLGYRRVRMSEITDEEIARMTHMLRGAEYEEIRDA